jgi:hypothetical protein
MMRIDDRNCVLLPKLNDEQMRILSERLVSKGFSVRDRVSLSASLKKRTIHVERKGVCWAAFDPADAIAPVIPALLEVRPQPLPLEVLLERYFVLGRSEGITTVRFLPRVEGSRLWRFLRASGECGLTPDELKIAKFILGASEGPCCLLTDFPSEGSKVRVLGSSRYYESSLEPFEVVATLRGIGPRQFRNSYLPRNGIVQLGRCCLPRRDLNELFMSLGEWSGFKPDSQKL